MRKKFLAILGLFLAFSVCSAACDSSDTPTSDGTTSTGEVNSGNEGEGSGNEGEGEGNEGENSGNEGEGSGNEGEGGGNEGEGGGNEGEGGGNEGEGGGNEGECQHTGGSATCLSKASCDSCGEEYGEKDVNNHESAEFSYINNGDGTHTKIHACCEAVVETVSHSGSATCLSKAFCDSCDEEYGEKDVNNHESAEFSYINNGDGTHTKVHACCEAVVETVSHSGWTDGDSENTLNCECGYTQTLITSLTTDIEIYPDAASAEINVSALGDVTICSASIDGVDITGELTDVGVYTLDLTNKGDVSGVQAITLTVQTADGEEHTVIVNGARFVTKVITQASELEALRFCAENNLTNVYYVLGGDIDASGVTCASGAYTWNQGFAGVFDGKGYTISNLTIGQGGIFGQIYGGTVKNVNLVNVVINDTSNYVTALASIVVNANVSDVKVSFASITVNSDYAYDTGLLCARQSYGTKWTNVTVDASGIDVVSVFGAQCVVEEDATSKNTFENVTVYASSITELCNTATGSGKTTSTAVSTLTGVTVEYVKGYAVTVPADSDYFVFDGKTMVIEGNDYTFSVTATKDGLDDFIVFVNGDEVTLVNGEYTVENVTDDLTIEVLHGYIEADEDYNVSVAYDGDAAKVTNAVYIASGINKAHGNAYISAEYLEYMAAQGYTKVQFNYVADGTTAARAVAYYGDTVVAYIADGSEKRIEFDLVAGSNNELAFVGQNADGSGGAIQGAGGYVTVKNLTFVKDRAVNTAFYFEGAAVTLEDDAFEEGNTYTVAANGESVEATVTTNGQLEVTFGSLTVGTTYTVVCEKDGATISFKKVTPVTKIITQASELDLLKFCTANNLTNVYYVLGCDIDASGVTCASGGYTWNQGFAGTFDGNGYTISNLTAGMGGIFGQIYGGTIKNVSFVDVTINSTDNYVSLFSSLNDKVTVTDVNVSFKSVTVNSSYAYDTGLLFSRQLGNATIKNVEIDASGIDVVSVFGAQCWNSTFENVTVYADSITELYNTNTGSGKTTSTAVTSVAGVTVYVPTFYAVSTPSTSDYYTFTGASKVVEGEGYTFSVTATKDGLDEFVVLVNGEAVTLEGGEYTVENVTEALTIEVLHGYIEAFGATDRNTSVAYNDDGSITITNAVFLADSTRAHGDAYISAEYIDYMVSQGYTKVSFTYVADGTTAATAVYRYNNSLVTCTTETAVTIDLVSGGGELEFNGWNANNSGYQIMNQGGYVTITGLTFSK